MWNKGIYFLTSFVSALRVVLVAKLVISDIILIYQHIICLLYFLNFID